MFTDGSDGHGLPEVNRRPQFLDGGMSRDDLVRRRARQEPGGERVFAGFRARGVEQLKQRARAEQIEIARKRLSVEEAPAVTPATGPGAVQAGETVLIPGTSTPRLLDAIDHAGMHDDQRHEDEGRQCQPPR